ncbi:MAG TPA: energy transducer TonB, partial [Chryseosolibacter sp.]|nr:energy transducer TonB [Chryseosolibacter sp.]
IRHWEDVVFENRNKSYGAYLLRTAYARRLWLGVGITVTLVTVLLLAPDFFPEEKINAKPPLNERTIDLEHPPIFEPRERPRHQQDQPRRSNVRDRQVLVTRDAVDETLVEDFEAVQEWNGDGADIGVIDGTGTIAAVNPDPPALPEVRDVAEIMPQYEGGMEAMMKFIQKKIKFPAAPRRLGLGGTVYVRFIVRGDGSIADIEVIKGVHPDYDKEAMRVISLLSAWKGGSHNGRPVSVRMVLPIKFNVK